MAKKHECPEFENHERWLVSYADMLTLLFAVFVTLFALKEGGEPEVQKAAGSMQESFNTPLQDIPLDRRIGPAQEGFGIFEHMQGSSLRPPLSQKYPSAESRIKVIDEDKIRDKALILVGFAGGFRRSELVNIYFQDIDFVPEGVKILIRRSKTDQSGEGSIKAIPYFENQEFCPVIALKDYLNKKFSNSNKSKKDVKIFEISDKSVALIIKKYAEKAGLDSSKYAGHSLRSGFATTAAEFGAEERNIMAMTGHKTTQMVRRYIQEANLFKNNALKNIKI